MKKLLALLMALVLTLSLAACGGGDDAGTTTAADNDVVTDAAADGNEDEAVPDATEADGTTAEDATAVDATTAEGETTVPGADMSKADFVKFINAETAKIAKSGKYALTRDCKYTKKIDVGGATDTLNGIIKGIDENASLDTVVGDFLGIGTTKGNIPADDVDSDYKIMKTSLNESDLGSFKADNGKYTFTLANATNPKKTAATPFARFTNDFITHEEVVEGIAGFTGAIKVKETTVNYKTIKVEVTVVDGKITNIKYSYAFDAVLSLTALVVPITGTGAAVTNTTYANITY